MAYPYLALRPTRNGLVSHYVVAGSKNPPPLVVGSVKENISLLHLLISLPDAVDRLSEWHDRRKTADEINETNLAEPEELIDTLKSINNTLLMLMEGFGNAPKEEQAMSYLAEQMHKLQAIMVDDRLIEGEIG